MVLLSGGSGTVNTTVTVDGGADMPGPPLLPPGPRGVNGGRRMITGGEQVEHCWSAPPGRGTPQVQGGVAVRGGCENGDGVRGDGGNVSGDSVVDDDGDGADGGEGGDGVKAGHVLFTQLLFTQLVA